MAISFPLWNAAEIEQVRHFTFQVKLSEIAGPFAINDSLIRMSGNPLQGFPVNRQVTT
ncbi:MAG: hypothetical protein KDA52_08150 [Planctomycetaceae bacterium]|nr:hypothetical protein [Planctomycetaceae bacterium]